MSNKNFNIFDFGFNQIKLIDLEDGRAGPQRIYSPEEIEKDCVNTHNDNWESWRELMNRLIAFTYSRIAYLPAPPSKIYLNSTRYRSYYDIVDILSGHVVGMLFRTHNVMRNPILAAVMHQNSHVVFWTTTSPTSVRARLAERILDSVFVATPQQQELARLRRDYGDLNSQLDAIEERLNKCNESQLEIAKAQSWNLLHDLSDSKGALRVVEGFKKFMREYEPDDQLKLQAIKQHLKALRSEFDAKKSPFIECEIDD